VEYLKFHIFIMIGCNYVKNANFVLLMPKKGLIEALFLMEENTTPTD